jgi:oligopeptidase A
MCSGIEWDAVEVPSQTLEKLVSDEAMLNSIAAHWQTGKPIPRDLFARVKGMRRFRGGDAMAYQVVQSVADIVMHGRDYDPAGPLSATAVLQQQYRRIMVSARKARGAVYMPCTYGAPTDVDNISSPLICT